MIDPTRVPSPCYVCDLGVIERNLSVLREVKSRTGCDILLALKGFAMFSVFPMLREHLDGVCASSPYEARLGREEFGKQVHAYAPAYAEQDIERYLEVADHMVFNTLGQWMRFRDQVRGRPGKSFGLRINPEYSEVEVDLYNPCVPGSRFGVRADELQGADLEGLDGFHFHTLCEQNADALARTVEVVEKNFGDRLEGLAWLNLGGGHHISRKDYDVNLLCDVVEHLQGTYHLRVVLEPGEAIALDAGVLVATVLDIMHNAMDIAVLDTSCTAHMPDVLEMPYRPEIEGAGQPGAYPHTYRLGGLTCLAGDVIGDYSFDEPLEVGQRLMFLDMAHYTMVKNTTFNGIQLPAIATYDPRNDAYRVVREFGYEAYRDRLS